MCVPNQHHPMNSRMMEPVNGRLPTACRCALMGYMAPDFTTIRRFVAWFSIAVLGVASWLPAEEMIRTGADGRLEHAAAYLISGLAVFTAYPRRLKWLITILMSCYAGILIRSALGPRSPRGDFGLGSKLRWRAVRVLVV